MKPVRAFSAADSSLHPTVAACRQHDLMLLLAEAELDNSIGNGGDAVEGDVRKLTGLLPKQVAEWLVANSQSVVSLLHKGGVTGTPRTASKLRKRTPKPAPEKPA